MPRVTYQQTNFTAGEISPRVHGRVDVDRYQNAAKQLLNAYPVIHGGARRRDGLRFIAATKHSGASRARLVTFIYSRDDAYVLEFGEVYLRIYRAGSDALITELATPYTAAMVAELDHAQGADTMFLAHPSVPMQRLRRLSSTVWSLDAVPWIVEPFDELGHTFATALTLSAATVGTGRTATAASGVFLESDVGRTLVAGLGVATITGYTSSTVVTVSITTAFSGTSIAASGWKLELSPYAFIRPFEARPVGAEINIFGGITRAADLSLSAKTGTITVTATAGIFAAGDVGKHLLAGSGKGEITVYTSATEITVATEDDFETQIYVTGAYGVTAPTWRAEDVGKFLRVNGGLAQVTAAGGQLARARILFELEGETTAPPLSWSLEMPVWSATNGYPRTVTLHEQRLIAAASNAYPQRIWGSRIGAYLDFTPGTADDDAFSFEIASDEVNPIGHLVSTRTLVAHTYGGEFSLQGGVEKPITPTNVRIRPESSHGSKGVRPVKIGRESVFVQRAGRKVRSMGYRYDFDGYAAPDLAVLAEHITQGGVVEMAYQQEPDSLLWAVRADGALLTCTLDRDQGVTGWAKHTTDGQFESVTTVPIGDRDETWVVVKRTIEGSPVRYVEALEQNYQQALSLVPDAPTFEAAVMDNDTTMPVPDHQAGDMIIAIRRAGFSGDAPPELLSGFSDIISGSATFPLAVRAQQLIDTDNSLASFSNSAGVANMVLVLRRGWTIGAVGHLNTESSASPIEFPDLDLINTDGSSTVVCVALLNQQRTITTPAGMELMLQNYTPTNFGGGEFSAWVKEGATSFENESAAFAGGGAYWHTIAFEIIPPAVEIDAGSDGSGDLLLNRFHVDSGKAYDVTDGITTLTGLDHLEGKDVDILADGAVLPRQTVNGGEITLPRTAYIVAVGLPYESRVTTLTPEIGTGMGSAQGNNMRTSEVTLRMLETVGGKVQAAGGQPQRIPYRQFGPDVLDAPTQPFSGLVRVETLGWDRGTSEVTVIQDQPLPMHVLSVIRKFTVNE